MKFNTKFDLYEKVYINEIKLYGVIVNIYISGDDKLVQYNLRYFVDSKANTCYFYEDELSKDKPKTELGFST